MLLKNIEEIKKHINFTGTTKFDTITSFINSAERDFIIPAIGQEQYGALDTGYNKTLPDLNANQLKLLAKVQAALTHLFFYYWIPSGQLKISDNGIRIANTADLKTAFQWQIDALQRKVLNDGGSAMDALFLFLVANRTGYPLWTASSSFTEFKQYFIGTAVEFTQLYSPMGNSRTVFVAVRNSMLKAQEFEITDAIGSEYYDELKTQYSGDNMTEKNKIVFGFVRKALAQFTMKRAITELSISIDERGILNFDNSRSGDIGSRTPAKNEHVSKMEMACDRDGNAYIQKMKQYLAININDYPTYANGTAYDGTTTDETYKNNPEANNYFFG